MTDPAGWQNESVGRGDKSEPTFDLVRSKPRNRVQPSGLVWRAPTQIAQLRSQGPSVAPAAATPGAKEDDEVNALWSGIAPRRRPRVVRVLGVALAAGTLLIAVHLLWSSPQAREETLSWVTLGHSQDAGRALQTAVSKMRRLVGQ